ncbi:hypothetical protein GGR56DRAFT_657772 [Xylariaceae sp. FL0804]|nr:hypothetical protein GGR56DRAFT_657772 [Xylariaceae sp. FL0804]
MPLLCGKSFVNYGLVVPVLLTLYLFQLSVYPCSLWKSPWLHAKPRVSFTVFISLQSPHENMADQPRRGRNRPDSRQMWDDSDYRGGRRGGRRDDRDRYRDEGRRDRDPRYRSRSRSPRRDRRDRHRSRSRDRRDRDWDRDQVNDRRRDYDRTGDRRDDRYSERSRDSRREPERGMRTGRARPGEDGMSRDIERHGDYPDSRDIADKADRGTHTSPLPARPKSGGAKQREDSGRGNRGRARGGDPRNASDHQTRPGRSPRSENAMDEDGGGDDDDDEMSAMQAMMGFGDFGSTKGKKVVGNNAGGVRKEKKTEYRQYMNRVGGFNRPLSPSR